MEDGQLKTIIESLIFASEAPLSVDRIKEVLSEVEKKEIRRLISELIEEYERGPRPFAIVEVADGLQFRTRPEYAEWIKKLKKIKPAGMSQPSLETLAIIAYKQPAVRADIERIRGVDSGGVLRTLLDRKLIKILGKKDIPGKPLVYGTSKKFLEIFGLRDLSSLPTLKDLDGLGPPAAEELRKFEAGQTEMEFVPAAEAEGEEIRPEEAGEGEFEESPMADGAMDPLPDPGLAREAENDGEPGPGGSSPSLMEAEPSAKEVLQPAPGAEFEDTPPPAETAAGRQETIDEPASKTTEDPR